VGLGIEEMKNRCEKRKMRHVDGGRIRVPTICGERASLSTELRSFSRFKCSL
jgi:hypothetical protein